MMGTTRNAPSENAPSGRDIADGGLGSGLGGTGLRRPSRPAIGVALVLAFLGAAMAVSLIAVWGLQ